MWLWILMTTQPRPYVCSRICGVIRNDGLEGTETVLVTGSVSLSSAPAIRERLKWAVCRGDSRNTAVNDRGHQDTALQSLLWDSFAEKPSKASRQHYVWFHSCRVLTYLRKHKSTALRRVSDHRTGKRGSL